MEKDQKEINKKIKKWLKIVIFLGLGIFLASLIFNRYFIESIFMNTRVKLFQRGIEKREQKYREDTFGGKTPQETYGMFLNALKKKDIELASKYFVLEKQKEYREAMEEIYKKEKWELMMEDLLQKNLVWRKVGETIVVLEIFNDQNNFLTQIGFLLPVKTFNNDVPLSSIWKIYSF